VRVASGTRATGLTLEGYDDLFKLLGQLPERLAKNAMTGAPTAAAKLVRDEIRVNARARFPLSRTLVRAIKHRRASTKGDDLRAFVFVERGTGAQYDAFYWRFLEYGTVKMGAKPFVRPGIDNSRGKVGDAMAAHIRKRFDAAVAKGKV
jgi:HK97 gp10 family phage protein